MTTTETTSSVLGGVAEAISRAVGRPTSFRTNYPFTVTREGRVAVRNADAAVFSAPSPSIETGLVVLVEGPADEDLLDELGYFAGPLAVVRSNGRLQAFSFTSPRVAEKIEDVPLEQAAQWIRGSFAPRVEHMAQMALPLAETRRLILDETRTGLARVVSALVDELMERERLDARDAFSRAIRVVRQAVFPRVSMRDASLEELVERHGLALTFPHLPLESVAEMYETLGLDRRDRRAAGVAYTPSWIAEYLVGRLPTSHAANEVAVDPTCGSGTFLVAYLDRLVADRARTREGTGFESEVLEGAVAGMDVDPVAVETSRLTLDMFASRLGLGPLSWDLRVGDATSQTIPGTSLVGNLPFGYRTHEGRFDVSSVILRRWIESEEFERLALLLPESFAYAQAAANARASLRRRYRVDEVLDLPEELFERTAAGTLAVVASRGKATDGFLVRRVDSRDLAAFQLSGRARTFASQLPPQVSDPWVLTPFFRDLVRAQERRSHRLGDIASIHLGLQTYGSPPSIFVPESTDAKPLLDDMDSFLRWDEGLRPHKFLRGAVGLRRTGPVDRYGESKLIVRATTNRRQVARLAAFVDRQGFWFSDKFIGIWPEGTGISLEGLAAYLQTGFVELWLAVNNPSRKLRVRTLEELPIPALPGDWWARASRLARPNRTVVSPRWRNVGRQRTLFDSIGGETSSDWQWFESAVDTAFGIDTATRQEMDEYLHDYLTVGRRAFS